MVTLLLLLLLLLLSDENSWTLEREGWKPDPDPDPDPLASILVVVARTEAKRSKRREKEEEEEEEEPGAVKGGEGIPVNSCTMARKFVVSVVRTVVGARREALVRFFVVGLGCKPVGDGFVERFGIWVWWVDPSAAVGVLKVVVGFGRTSSRFRKEFEESGLKFVGCKLKLEGKS